MRVIIAKIFVGLVLVSFATLVHGEVVQEETWYNADGKVVKTVKRTMTGADARKTDDWEPAWVVRERQRQRPGRSVRYYASNRRGYGDGNGYGSYWGTGYYGYGSSVSCSPRRYRSSGFTGYFRGGRGGSRWGASYRAPRISTGFRR